MVSVEGHLRELVVLANASYQDQVAQFDALLAAADNGPSQRLSLALARSLPGHPGSDLGRAYDELLELGAEDSGLSEGERLLAQVTLREAENALIIDSDNTRLRRKLDASPTPRARRDPGTLARLRALTQELAASEAARAELQQALDEAQAQLDAITNIETSDDRR